MGRGTCVTQLLDNAIPECRQVGIVPRSAANRVTMLNSSLAEGAKVSVFDGRNVIMYRGRRGAV